MAKVIVTPYLTFENAAEVARVAGITAALDAFVEDGIYALIEKNAKIAREELVTAAPYDYQELDDYHMRQHIERDDFESPELGKGQEINSEAEYSWNLEYGHTRHGKHQNWFRPTMYKNQAKTKVDVIKTIARIMMK